MTDTIDYDDNSDDNVVDDDEAQAAEKGAVTDLNLELQPIGKD